jgi:hypothetical protein
MLWASRKLRERKYSRSPARAATPSPKAQTTSSVTNVFAETTVAFGCLPELSEGFWKLHRRVVLKPRAIEVASIETLQF